MLEFPHHLREAHISIHSHLLAYHEKWHPFKEGLAVREHFQLAIRNRLMIFVSYLLSVDINDGHLALNSSAPDSVPLVAWIACKPFIGYFGRMIVVKERSNLNNF